MIASEALAEGEYVVFCVVGLVRTRELTRVFCHSGRSRRRRIEAHKNIP